MSDVPQWIGSIGNVSDWTMLHVQMYYEDEYDCGRVRVHVKPKLARGRSATSYIIEPEQMTAAQGMEFLCEAGRLGLLDSFGKAECVSKYKLNNQKTRQEMHAASWTSQMVPSSKTKPAQPKRKKPAPAVITTQQRDTSKEESRQLAPSRPVVKSKAPKASTAPPAITTHMHVSDDAELEAALYPALALRLGVSNAMNMYSFDSCDGSSGSDGSTRSVSPSKGISLYEFKCDDKDGGGVMTDQSELGPSRTSSSLQTSLSVVIEQDYEPENAEVSATQAMPDTPSIGAQPVGTNVITSALHERFKQYVSQPLVVGVAVSTQPATLSTPYSPPRDPRLARAAPKPPMPERAPNAPPPYSPPRDPRLAPAAPKPPMPERFLKAPPPAPPALPSLSWSTLSEDAVDACRRHAMERRAGGMAPPHIGKGIGKGSGGRGAPRVSHWLGRAAECESQDHSDRVLAGGRGRGYSREPSRRSFSLSYSPDRRRERDNRVRKHRSSRSRSRSRERKPKNALAPPPVPTERAQLEEMRNRLAKQESDFKERERKMVEAAQRQLKAQQVCFNDQLMWNQAAMRQQAGQSSLFANAAQPAPSPKLRDPRKRMPRWSNGDIKQYRAVATPLQRLSLIEHPLPRDTLGAAESSRVAEGRPAL